MVSKKTKPVEKQIVPDPADVYERCHPEHESGQGRLDNNTKATPTDQPDKMAEGVTHKQDGTKQINAHDQSTTQ